jgi:hypothetical protein
MFSTLAKVLDSSASRNGFFNSLLDDLAVLTRGTHTVECVLVFGAQAIGCGSRG